MQDQIYDMLVNKDEVTWQTIIHDLVKSEQMDPWGIDITLLAERYLAAVKDLQQHNFHISGKVILAAAILLNIKTTKLIEEDIANFDSMLFSKDEDLLEDDNPVMIGNREVPSLLIKTPQLRKRKVSLNDLMEALTMALKVEEKRLIRKKREEIVRHAELPVKKFDISALMKEVYDRIVTLFSKSQKLTFKELVPSNSKEDIITAFIPLLHLSNERKVDLEQEISFGDINITIYKKPEELK
ncbi:MAG TPA: ScpA family protein [Candidatus Nanoarchaeia archaeon]|nr:ScpA family protein [Candidatus Nanoarchaeia archaeon]